MKMMKKYLVFNAIAIILTIGIGSCSQKDNETAAEEPQPIDTIPQLVFQVQKCSRLYTTEYQVHKIVTHDDVMKVKGTLFSKNYSFRLPIGDRRVAIPMDATLKAYIDLSTFSEQSVERDGQKITIILPAPKVVLTASKVDQAGVREYVSLTRANFSDRELTAFEQQGREAILQTIPSMGIVEQARYNAAKLLIPIIKQMGFAEEDITIVFPDDFDPHNLQKLVETKPLAR